jgi:PAS domain S-box-containing protein
MKDAQRDAKRLRQVVEAAPNAFVLVNAAGNIEMVNAQTEKLFGYTRSELLGQPVEMLLPERFRSQHSALRTAFSSSPEARRIGAGRDLVGLHKLGREVPVEIGLNPIELDEGAMVLAAIVDITERKHRDTLLRQSQKMEAVGQLTGGVAHDFNNLLAVILGNLELADDQLPDDSPLKPLIQQAIESVDRGASLTQRLLAYARQQPLDPKVLDIHNLVSNITELLRRSLGETIRIQAVLPKDLWKTRVDPNQLENALLNLAVNARDAMPGGGRLTIEAHNSHLDSDYAEDNSEVTPGEYVMLAVTDTGTGMVPVVMDRALEPFFTTKSVGKGSGLGLSMVYGFVKQSGGHIKIYSEPGRGTTIKLFLPRAEGNAADAPGEEVALYRAPIATEAILVVEDDASIRKLVAAMLDSLGYKVAQAEDGPSAQLALAKEEEPNLLLTDMVLPNGMSGVDLGRQARTQYPKLKVLYMSGYTNNALAFNGSHDESAHLLSKPFRRQELARAVRDVLDK